MLKNFSKNLQEAVKETEKGNNAISVKKKKLEKFNASMLKPGLNMINPEVNERLFDPLTAGGEEALLKKFD